MKLGSPEGEARARYLEAIKGGGQRRHPDASQVRSNRLQNPATNAIPLNGGQAFRTAWGYSHKARAPAGVYRRPLYADMEAEVDVVVVAAERGGREGGEAIWERKPESMLPRHAC
jgi:hypothetical protein